jgi:hypothetical protein
MTRSFRRSDTARPLSVQEVGARRHPHRPVGAFSVFDAWARDLFARLSVEVRYPQNLATRPCTERSIS